MRLHIAIIALLGGIFLLLGWAGGAASPVDSTVVTTLAEARNASPWLTPWIVMLTHLGSVWATLGATAVAAVWLLYQRQRMEAGVLAATVVGGRLLNDGLKLLYDRPRPAFDAHPVLTSSSSFPSGHAANTMIAFVAIALALTPARHRALALNVAVIVAAAIGLSRPYLGVHWPSDVLGGWLLAAMVLLLSRIAQTSLCSPEEQHQVVGGHATPIDRG